MKIATVTEKEGLVPGYEIHRHHWCGFMAVVTSLVVWWNMHRQRATTVVGFFFDGGLRQWGFQDGG